MNDSDAELRARLTAADPMSPSAVVEPLQRERGAQILEAAMTTSRPPTRRLFLLGAAAAAVLAVGTFAALRAGDEPDSTASPPAPTTLELALPAPEVSASCVEFRVEYLADMPTAFAGTVTDISDTAVTFDVERWYAGGSADVVVVAKVDPGSSAVLDAVTFEEDQEYLVTASESGVLNGCGFSGPASPKLTAAFAAAFPA